MKRPFDHYAQNIVLGFAEILDGVIRIATLGIGLPQFGIKWIMTYSKMRMKLKNEQQLRE